MRDDGVEIIDTTLGSLIEAVSEAALELCGNERGAYFLAGLVLQEIFAKSRLLAAGAEGSAMHGLHDEKDFH